MYELGVSERGQAGRGVMGFAGLEADHMRSTLDQ